MRFASPAIIAALLALPPTGAQQPSREAKEPLSTITVDVDVVNIYCSVYAKKGGYLTDLSREDFSLFEEKKEQQIRYFSRETDLPVTMGMLVDVSGSQASLIEVERRAAAAFFSAVMRPKDMAFLISFGPEVELLQDFTNSVPYLRTALDRLEARSGVGGLHPGPVPTVSQPRGTVLWDAVWLAAREKLRGEVGRKALILITDGVDTGSRVSLNEALEAAQKADTIIYSIYYVDPGAYSRGGYWGAPSSSDLRKLSEETGGRMFEVSRKFSLQDIFRQIQDEMRSQYAIGYTPSSPEKDGTFRRIEIKVNRKDAKVQARKGYYAGRQGS